jgi:SAM-dependent methyltransferase
MATDGQHGSWEQAVEWLRSQPDQRELVVDAYYDDPLLEAATRYWHSEEWQEIRRWLPGTRGNALDVGAGRGIASFALACDGFLVVALEPDPSPIVGAGAIRALANAAALPIEVCQQRSEKLPFEDGQFDVVFARAALHHVSNLPAVARELHRVLKPGGRLVAVREHVISKVADLQAFLSEHALHRLYGGENALLLSDYLGAIREAGFTIARVIPSMEGSINIAPYTTSSLQSAVASRIARRVPGLAALLRGLFRIPGVWLLTCRAMSIADQRPGRLYSFIANRP